MPKVPVGMHAPITAPRREAGTQHRSFSKLYLSTATLTFTLFNDTIEHIDPQHVLQHGQLVLVHLRAWFQQSMIDRECGLGM